MLRGYKRDDPPTLPQLAVPVALLRHLLDSTWRHTAQHGHCPHREAQADLCNIALYYLLRVGEYTPPRTSGTRNTVPFAVKNVTFWQGQHIIPNTAPLDQLYQATAASIVIPRQKNGTKGQCITQDCTQTVHSPIKSLARRVHHILSNGGSLDTAIHCVKHPFYTRDRAVTAHNINCLLKQAAGEIGLYTRGYEPSDISSHSLRAGGAMALHLNGADAQTIQKLGRWKSTTFLQYIHEQISAFSAGLSTKMSTDIPFAHMAGPRTHTVL